MSLSSLFCAWWTLLLVAFLSFAPTTTSQLPPKTLQKFQSFGFGMVSYYDTVTSKAAQTELIQFINRHNVTFLNQYVCSVTSAADYAYFIDNIYNHTGAKINMLFDETLVEHSHNSTCDIACTPGSSTGTGWCCASVARKFAWMVEVLTLTTQPNALDGAAFDIEGLKDADYMDLWRTMRVHWNNTVAPVKGSQVLRWYFGSELSSLAVAAVREGLIDQIYWENYQNSVPGYTARAKRMLDPLNAMVNQTNHTHVSIHGFPVCLLSEINCCATPCLYSDSCGLCGTYELEERKVISFCGANEAPPKPPPFWMATQQDREHSREREQERHRRGKMDVSYMLQTMADARAQLIDAGYYYLLAPNILYDYRAIFMKIYGRDTMGDHLCPKKTPVHALLASNAVL